MIQGNQTWQNALAQQQKQPLYIFEISDFGVIIASFSAEAVNVDLYMALPSFFQVTSNAWSPCFESAQVQPAGHIGPAAGNSHSAASGQNGS